MKTMNIRTTVDKTRDARPLLFLYGLIASLIFSLMLIQPAFSEAFTLGTVKQGVLRDYKNVSHMETAELQNLIVNKKDVLIFDVRSQVNFLWSVFCHLSMTLCIGWAVGQLNKVGCGVQCPIKQLCNVMCLNMWRGRYPDTHQAI